MDLKNFLIKAKTLTYASAGEGREKILADGSKELSYKNGPWQYRDRYFGFDPFIGEEIVWKNGRIIWGLNYYGQITSTKIDSRAIYKFLQSALRLVQASRPFRGPKVFSIADWNYQDQSSGSINSFSGHEVIYFKTKKVYELKYQGGLIKK